MFACIYEQSQSYLSTDEEYLMGNNMQKGDKVHKLRNATDLYKWNNIIRIWIQGEIREISEDFW